jgi:hypothetical protein
LMAGARTTSHGPRARADPMARRATAHLVLGAGHVGAARPRRSRDGPGHRQRPRGGATGAHKAMGRLSGRASEGGGHMEGGTRSRWSPTTGCNAARLGALRHAGRHWDAVSRQNDWSISPWGGGRARGLETAGQVRAAGRRWMYAGATGTQKILVVFLIGVLMVRSGRGGGRADRAREG